MMRTDEGTTLYRPRPAPKDIGVALVTLAALLLGWAILWQETSRTTTFAEPESSFSVAFPATWTEAASLEEPLLKVEDPDSPGEFKTALTIERRDLDPQAPPTLQELVDRRVEQRAQLQGYHFLANREVMVDGARAAEIEYAYTVQPIDTPRRASLPVVVVAREVIIVAGDRTYYMTMAASERDLERARARFDTVMRTVQVQ